MLRNTISCFFSWSGRCYSRDLQLHPFAFLRGSDNQRQRGELVSSLVRTPLFDLPPDQSVVLLTARETDNNKCLLLLVVSRQSPDPGKPTVNKDAYDVITLQCMRERMERRGLSQGLSRAGGK
jgi:hypothetical protein